MAIRIQRTLGFVRHAGRNEVIRFRSPKKKVEIYPSTENESEIIELIVRAKNVTFAMGKPNQEFYLSLLNIYKKMVGAKNSSDIIYDVIFTKRRVLIRPVSKVSLAVHAVSFFLWVIMKRLR